MGVSGRKLKDRQRSVLQETSPGAPEFVFSLPGPLSNCSGHLACVFSSLLFNFLNYDIKCRHFHRFPWNYWAEEQNLG
jgi:hypothetical protein